MLTSNHKLRSPHARLSFYVSLIPSCLILNSITASLSSICCLFLLLHYSFPFIHIPVMFSSLCYSSDPALNSLPSVCRLFPLAFSSSPYACRLYPLALNSLPSVCRLFSLALNWLPSACRLLPIALYFVFPSTYPSFPHVPF